MKKNIGIIIFLFISVYALAETPYELWKKRIIKNGQEQLSRIQEENSFNDWNGNSDENHYVILVSTEVNEGDAEYIKQRKGLGKGTDANYILQDETLNRLDNILRDINRTSEIKSYLLVVNFYPLELITDIPDGLTIGAFINSNKAENLKITENMRDEASSIVNSITNEEFGKAKSPIFYCGFVNFKVFIKADEGHSQWIYYPRFAAIDRTDEYKTMIAQAVKKATWDRSDVKKVETLIGLIKTNNEEFAQLNKSLLTLADIKEAPLMQDELAKLSNNAFSALSSELRIYVLKILSRDNIPIERETIINRLIETVQSPNDANELIAALKATHDKLPPKISQPIQGMNAEIDNPKIGWCLLRCITQETHDTKLLIWGADNYQRLIRGFISLCKISSDFAEKAKKLSAVNDNDLLASRTIYYNYNSFWTKLSGHIGHFPDPKMERSTDYSDNCQLESNSSLFFNYFYDVTLSKDLLDPFEPIVFVNKSDLGMLTDIEDGKTIFISPAIILKYVDDKAWNQSASDGTMAVVDAASLATGYGELKAGVTGLRKAWVLMDMANSSINLTLNASLASKDPQVKKILDAYNLLSGGVTTTRVVSGGIQNVYNLTKSKDVLKSADIKDFIKVADDAPEGAFRSLTDEDLKSIELTVKRVKDEANAMELGPLENQAERVLGKIGNVSKSDWISNLFESNQDLIVFRQSVITNGRKMSLYLSAEEETIIGYYTTSKGYTNLNKALRGEMTKTEFLEAYEKLLVQAINKLPIYPNQAELWRGIKNVNIDDIKKLYQKDEIVTEGGFLSTAYSLPDFITSSRVRDFEVLFKIQGKNGKLIESMSTLPEEAEVIFNRGSKFRVKSIGNEMHPDPKYESINGVPWILTIVMEEL